METKKEMMDELCGTCGGSGTNPNAPDPAPGDMPEPSPCPTCGGSGTMPPSKGY